MSRSLLPDAPASSSEAASSEAEEAFEAAIDVDEEAAPSDAFIDEMLSGAADEAAAADDIDLAPDQRMAIDLAFKGIEEKSFYEVLLLPRSADGKAIKRAYYRLSKEYHPDKFYRKSLGPYKLKLEVIFNKITEAYRILSDPSSRGDYDDLVFGKPEKAVEVAKPSEASTTVTFVPEAEKKRQAAEEARRAARREAEKKKSRPIFMQNLQKQLAQRIAKAKVALAAGEAAAAAGNWEEAAAQFQMAMTYDERNPKAKVLFKRAQAQHRNSRADEYARQARDALLTEDTKRAAALYQKAVDCKPTKGKHYFDFGKLVLEHTFQQKTGLDLVSKAVEYEPRNVEYNLELGRVYETMGMASKAQRTFERVLQLEPKNSEANKALKRLK
jgi:curved DNA-binding protein CbpA